MGAAHRGTRKDRKGCEIKKGSKKHKVTFRDQIPTEDFSVQNSMMEAPHLTTEEFSVMFNYDREDQSKDQSELFERRGEDAAIKDGGDIQTESMSFLT